MIPAAHAAAGWLLSRRRSNYLCRYEAQPEKSVGYDPEVYAGGGVSSEASSDSITALSGSSTFIATLKGGGCSGKEGSPCRVSTWTFSVVRGGAMGLAYGRPVTASPPMGVAYGSP